MVAEEVRDLIAHAERAAEQVHRQALERASADRESVRRTAVQVVSDIDALEAKVMRTLAALREEAMEIAGAIDGQPAVARARERRPEPEPQAEPSSSVGRAPNGDGEAEQAAYRTEDVDDAEPVSGQVDHPREEEDGRAEAPAEEIEEAQPVPGPADESVEAEPLARRDDADPVTEAADTAKAAQPDTAQETSTGEAATPAADPVRVQQSHDLHESAHRRAPPRRGGLLGRLRRGGPPACAVCARIAAADEDITPWRRAGSVSVCPGCQSEGWQLPDHGSVPYRSTYRRESR